MKVWIIAGAVAALSLGGCQKAPGGAASSLTPQSKGRYVGVGLFPAGRMWEQVVVADPAKDSAARPADDEEIIVVLDSTTGELRQCGNLSGACIGMNPWAKPASQMAPTALVKHAQQLDDEAAKPESVSGAITIAPAAKH
jgi:hypothetical protein